MQNEYRPIDGVHIEITIKRSVMSNLFVVSNDTEHKSDSKLSRLMDIA